MSVIDDLLDKAPEVRTVEFCKDPALGAELAKAVAARDNAQRRFDLSPDDQDRSDALAAAEAVLESVRERVAGSLLRFTFQSISPGEYDRLKAEHRPSEKQKTDARKGGRQSPDWNTDTFPAALLAAACVKVETPGSTADGLSLEDADRLWQSDRWNEAERSELFTAALSAYLTRTQVDLPKAG